MKTKKYISEIKILRNKDLFNYTAILEKYKKYKRSLVKINENKNNIIILIEADDVTALRASINGVLREIQIIQKIKSLK